MQNLTPQQAQALWDAGGFTILPDLPEGSEYGLDGTYHTIRKSFTGSKFVPPGLHLITISPASPGRSSSSSLGPGAIPLRSGILIHLRPRERLVLSYDTGTESLAYTSSDTSMISDDHLRSLDPGLAAYPFDGLDAWKSLTNSISEDVVLEVLGPRGIGVDGMRGVEGDKDDLAVSGHPEGVGVQDGGGKMRFVHFDLRRSWRDGAVGEELTRWARDKSWLLASVLEGVGQDPLTLLGHLQLAFILLLHLSSPSSLTVYKRLFSLLCRSTNIHVQPLEHLPAPLHAGLRALYISFIAAFTAQIQALPDGVFDTELPELDVWYNEELEALRGNISRAMGEADGLWADGEARKELRVGWEGMRVVARRKFGWEIGELQSLAQLFDGLGEEDEDEDGEYAPVVVDVPDDL